MMENQHDPLPTFNTSQEVTSSKTNYWMISTFVLLVLLIGMSIVLVSILNREKDLLPVESSQNGNAVIQPPAEIDDNKEQALSWKTYENLESKFEFQYPSTYKLSDENFAVKSEADVNDFFSIELWSNEYDQMGQTPGIRLVAINTSKSPEQYVQDTYQKELTGWEEFKKEMDNYENAPNPVIESQENAKNNSISALKVVRVRAPNTPNNHETQYYFKNGTVLYVLTANYGSDTSLGDEKEVVEKVFQDFRFTD